jgi:coiled-coil domain-containing protein 55
MKVSFSLTTKSKPAPVGAAPSLKRPAAFASLDDEATEDPAPSTAGNSKLAANKQLISQNVELSKAAKKRLEAEQKVDSTVFQYDEIWDNMQYSKLRQKEAKEVDAKERKVRTHSGICLSLVTDSIRSPNTLVVS